MATKYSEYAPSGFDARGLGLEDRQAWLVVIGRNRDSGVLAESNFASALTSLGGESETCEIHRFGHWGCGWFELILLHPDRETEADSIESALADYPVLDDSDYSERECEALSESWESWGAAECAQKLVDMFSNTDRHSSGFYEFLRTNSDDLYALHCEHSSGDHMSDEGGHFDFHWIADAPFTREAFCAWIVKTRAASRAREAAASVSVAV